MLLYVLGTGAVILLALLFFGPLFAEPRVVGNTVVQLIPAQKKPITIFLAGDMMFDRGIRYYATVNGGNQYIFNGVKHFLEQNDLNVLNLEGPITDNASLSEGSAPGSYYNYFFTFDPSWAQTLYDNHIRLVNIGNNHINNFGAEGVRQTKQFLDGAKVGYFGAPDYPKTAGMEIRGVKLEFINYNQFSAVSPETEEMQALENIRAAKQRADVVIVFPHWGEEYQDEPTEEQQRLAHEFIDEGADLVAGSHPHVIQTVEDYQGKRIYYSLGNFIFDQYFSKEVRTGLGVTVSINPKTKALSFKEQRFYLQSGGQTVLFP